MSQNLVYNCFLQKNKERCVLIVTLREGRMTYRFQRRSHKSPCQITTHTNCPYRL